MATSYAFIQPGTQSIIPFEDGDFILVYEDEDAVDLNQDKAAGTIADGEWGELHTIGSVAFKAETPPDESLFDDFVFERDRRIEEELSIPVVRVTWNEQSREDANDNN